MEPVQHVKNVRLSMEHLIQKFYFYNYPIVEHDEVPSFFSLFTPSRWVHQYSWGWGMAPWVGGG